MTLQYAEYGDKSAPLMVFLHGGGVSGWMWEKQIEYFRHYHCIVPNLPEHGLNNDQHQFSMKGSAEEVIKIIEERATGKGVIVIGFSLGAQVLMQMMSMRFDLVDVAIINSALVRPSRYAEKWIRPTIRFSFPLIKKRWFSRLQAKTLYIGDAHFETYYKESCHIKPDTLIRVLKENMSFTIPETFAKARGKILVTVGNKEKAIMKRSAQDIVAANRNCMGVLIPNVGHGAPLATPDLFNKMIEKWLLDGHVPEGFPLID